MNFSDIFTAIKKGAVVITVNQRLARHLLNRVEQAYIKEGIVTWPSPSILSFDVWLNQLWQQRFDSVVDEVVQPLIAKTLLTKDQALVIWERVIRQSSSAELLNVAATAKAAHKARQFSVQWQIGNGNGFNASEDIAAFNQWHKVYKTELLKAGWIDSVQLLSTATELMRNSCLPCPKEVILAGFDIFTPSQKDCWALLESKGCTVSMYSSNESPQSVNVLSALDVKHEMACVAQWARERLNDNPNAVIGIVVWELEAVRQTLETAFREAFYPSATYAVDVPFEKPYNVSLGLPLSSYAPVKQALRLLQFFSKPLPLSELSLLLRSSFLVAGQAEWGSRARLEVNLRKNGVLNCSVKKLFKELEPNEGVLQTKQNRQEVAATDNESICPMLHIFLGEVIQRLGGKTKRVAPSQWVGVFRELLTTIKVKGDRELSSVEYQVFQAWDKGLRTFAGLDAMYGVIDYAAALSALRRLMADTVFQPETLPAPIQIMGLMEAAGHRFDALWVCGLHEKCWPPAPQPSPFLSIVEQRKQGLVQSSAEHQYKYAKQVTENWASSAQAVVFSYSSSDGESAQQVSPLLDDYPVISVDDLLKEQPVNRFEPRIGNEPLMLVEDNSGPVVDANVISHGGTGVLKDQSACPFKAFVHYRLKTKAIEEPELGIDARLRGSLVHSALEGVWDKLKDQKTLNDYDADTLADLVDGIVKQVVQRESYRTPMLKKALGQLEVKRISELLLDWLAIDKQRESFTVLETEWRQTLTVGQLNLNTVIDRVDQLQDGSTAVIDYKTGATAVGKWFGERPEEPQLPLYSVFGREGVESISFAQLKKGDVKYVGLSDKPTQFSALKGLDDGKVKADATDWASQMNHWKGVMTTLSDEFVAGDARVSPTKKACEYCDLNSLCRINEQNSRGGDE